MTQPKNTQPPKLRQPGRHNGVPFTFKEKVDVHALQYIVENFSTLEFNSAIDFDDTSKLAMETMCKKYLKMVKPGGFVTINYKQAKKSKTGRQFSTTVSQQTLCKKIRHTIARDNYMDVDMKNAHPQIASQYCASKSIDCPNLNKYINDRDAILEEIASTGYTKEEAKTAFLAVLNGGKGKDIDHPLLNDFRDEIESIHTQIAALEPKIFNRALNKNEHNPFGSCINLILCDYENDLLMEMVEKFQQLGMTTASIQFDGLCVEKNPLLTEEILLKVEKHIKEATGFDIGLAFKPMDKGFIIPIIEPVIDKADEIKCADHDSVTSMDEHADPLKQYWIIMLNDLKSFDQGYSRIFVRGNKDNIVVIDPTKNGYCYIYDEATALWKKRENIFIKALVGDYMEKIVNECRIHLLEMKKKTDCEVEVDLKSLAAVMRSVSTNSTNTFEKVLTKLYQEDFESKLNKIPHLIPVKNAKVVNLRTGEVLKRKQDMLFSFECPVNYRPKHTLTRVKKFFLEIMNGVPEMVDYLQKVLGYGITGETSGRVFFIFYGCGANGKGTLMETLNIMLSEFYITVSRDVMIKAPERSHHKASGAATPHLIKLKKGRMGVCSEIDEGDQLNETVIKNVSGQDEMAVRDVFKSEETFVSQDKLFLQTNDKPVFTLNDSMMDRIRYIPFLARFSEHPVGDEKLKDPVMGDWLRGEGLDDVFTFIVKGAIEWYTNGFGVLPKEVQEFTKSCLNDLDIAGKFVAARLERVTVVYPAPEPFIRGAELYVEYRSFCSETGAKPDAASKFGEKIKRHLGNPTKSGVIKYMGWRIKPIENEVEEDEPISSFGFSN